MLKKIMYYGKTIKFSMILNIIKLETLSRHVKNEYAIIFGEKEEIFLRLFM